MPLFLKDRAYKFFNHHSLEMINRNINLQVNVYKMVLKESSANIYGESTGGKAYYPPVKAHAVFQHDDPTFDYNAQRFGVDINATATFFFQREYLKAIDLMVEIGDIAEWNESYWHIDSVVENRLIHSDSKYNMAMVCSAHMTERSHLHIEETRYGSDDITDIQKLKNL